MQWAIFIGTSNFELWGLLGALDALDFELRTKASPKFDAQTFIKLIKSIKATNSFKVYAFICKFQALNTVVCDRAVTYAKNASTLKQFGGFKGF